MKKMLFICLCIFVMNETARTQNQVFWGLTPHGGQYSGGTIFSINNDGTGIHVEHDFQPPAGYTPYGSLLQASNGSLYGTCHDGGSFASCTIFRFDPSTNTYTDVYDFDITHGDYPRSGVIEAANGKLYGVARAGGLGGGGNNGVLYSFDPLTNTYTDEYDFDLVNGSAAWGCPLNVNGILYGMTSLGGATSAGVLYSYNINTDTYTNLFDFSTTTGTSPFGSLIRAGNGMLYGMTNQGGINNKGVIFKYDPAANVYSKLFDFDGANGEAPVSSLFEASNGLLYGVTTVGGSGNTGVLFSFNSVTNIYVKLIDFTGANGIWPAGGLMQGNNTKLYGITTAGGTNNVGTMFSYDPASGTIANLFDFTNVSGFGATGTFTVVTATGIQQPAGSNGQLSFYPNPARDKITIKLDVEKQEKVEINLINTMGQNIYSFTENNAGAAYSKTIDMINFKNGIYFLECIINGEKTVTKVNKQ